MCKIIIQYILRLADRVAGRICSEQMAEKEDKVNREKSMHANFQVQPDQRLGSSYWKCSELESKGFWENDRPCRDVGSDKLKSTSRKQLPVLVVGNYCHDCIRLASGPSMDVLGGSASYISNVLDALGVELHVVSKVGRDFKFISEVSHAPLIIEGQNTTQFFADYLLGKDRVLRVGKVCEQILPSEIPSERKFSLGLAVGVAEEINISVVEQMLRVSQLLIVDLQALIRRFDPKKGDLNLQHLKNTAFHNILERIAFLKATRAESMYIDLDSARQVTCVLVTDGKYGSTVYQGDKEYHVPPFPAEEVDPTGAGDSFLAGFVAALYRRFPVEKAALMGNYFGALAVSQIGIPQIKPADMQEFQKIFHAMDKQESNCILRTDSLKCTDKYSTS